MSKMSDIQDVSGTKWVAVDWGTSHLRLWLKDAQNRLIACLEDERGMGKLTSDDFEPVLNELLHPVLEQCDHLTVVCCGMCGSRQGWQEAPYLSVPCAPQEAGGFVKVATQNPKLDVYILPGIKQMQPHDVMRGEETQIAGVMAQDADFSGVVCLPGTHSKWAQISDGAVTNFATFMTGEVFALLKDGSVLRHSICGDHWDWKAFEEAVIAGSENAEGLLANLFGIRATDLLAPPAAGAGIASLSGLLIGAELRGAQSYWQGQNVRLVGASKLSKLYQTALAALGADSQILDAQDATLNGLKRAYDALKNNEE